MWCPKSCGGTCPVPTEGNLIWFYATHSTDSLGIDLEASVSLCGRCKAIVKSTDIVLDALRIGQDALDKATALQFKGSLESPCSHNLNANRCVFV